MRALNKAFAEYGEDIKEFQWLVYLNERTGKDGFAFTPELDPFVSMGWLRKKGDLCYLKEGDEFYIEQVMEVCEIKPRAEKRPRLRHPTKYDEAAEYVKSVFTLPADIHINKKYTFQLTGLCEKFSIGLVISVASWYDMNRGLLPKEYQDLKYEQFMHHGMFQALHKWMTDGVPKTQDSDEVDFRNRVC